MSNLPELLAGEVAKWRGGGYACDFPLIGEILRFQRDGEAGGGLRYLRSAQFAALETYWYLRLVRKTASVLDIYRDMYPQPHIFVQALGVPLTQQDTFEMNSVGDIIEKIKDPEWADERGIDALHEAATLPYSGYIFALAMGAGKTVLIGAIIATEFAMAMRYNGGGGGARFMQNALVFAPGNTIIRSLREISEMPMETILPADWLRGYQAGVSVIFAQKGEKDINVLPRGKYNIIISNTEKVILRADGGDKKQTRLTFEQDEKEKQDRVNANIRLQKIISLPNLGVFSDEAHHTYGNSANESLKRVRQTVNYIHKNTALVAAVNTTGTPYHKRKMLPDVVFWYGLREGIRDNVLKGLWEGIVSYRIEEGETEMLKEVVSHFFEKYGDVRLPDGAPAKIAFYFKQQNHLDESRPHIEKTLSELGIPLTCVLAATQKSPQEDIDEFHRLKDPTNQKRVILLVRIGMEGWDCPSLFACALIKQQAGEVSVLQSATRCLRQTPGNSVHATIYLSAENREILDRGLQKNFGSGVNTGTISGDAPMRQIAVERGELSAPRLEIIREDRCIVYKPNRKTEVKFTKPKAQQARDMTIEISKLNFVNSSISSPTDVRTIAVRGNVSDCYTQAARIAANYHLEAFPVLQKLKAVYPDGEIPAEDIAELWRQAEEQTADYEERTEKVRRVLALIRDVDDQGEPVFEEDAAGRRVHILQFSEDAFKRMQKNGLVVSKKRGLEIGKTKYENTALFAEQVEDGSGLSYHYSPYCFDSKPEKEFFERILTALNERAEDISAFVFTGLANSRLTDFWFYYQGEDGAYHRYFPDFLLVKKSGEFFVVEIKSVRDRDNAVVKAKEKAVRVLADMPENKFRYVIIYVNGVNMEAETGMRAVREWMQEKGKTK